MKLSIIVPVFNEESTIRKVLDSLVKVDLKIKKEIIIIDDGSTDISKKLINQYIKENKTNIKFKFFSKSNGGKGSAIRKGISISTGDIIAIQDADLEYNPQDYRKLIKLIVDKKEKVVYGSRFLKKHKPLYKIYFLGNKFLTLLTEAIYRVRITDMETCYKVFKSDVIKKIKLEADHFDIEPEITAKLLKLGIRIKEVPISYTPRSVKEGKKINWKDGLQAIWTLIYWRFKNTSVIHQNN